ncbi:DUF3152 domain-containing protein [Prauserella cavernicola]|uniref:DUF3152 domain-containing protein n=1 Tax=Prauserella cavernicola TaxID=2800127 RepID=UPI0027DC6F4C|nr:DUF3152 domain-containing protein [Prauserella cavernicola]
MDRVTHGVRKDGGRTEYPRRSSSYHYRPKSPSEDRYRPGARRASGEPLRASWQPANEPEEPAEDEKPRKPSALRRLVSTYGWRAYAIPVLLVITALVVVDTTRGAPEGESGSAAGGTSENAVDTGGSSSSPVATENPAGQVDLDIPTAKLPQGGDFTAKGAGTWHVVPGASDPVGESDNVRTYTVEVEDGIDPASYAGDDSFADTVEGTLSDPRSWIGSGEVSLRRVDASYPDPDFRVSLTTSDTTHRPDICGGSIPFESSCYRRNVDGENRVVINLARWVRGALAFSSDMTGYRQYAINHEVGHALDNGHEGCGTDGALAPVMMQQTFGVANDYVAQLNDGPGGDQGTVPADGKTCKPNAWPNPQVQGR